MDRYEGAGASGQQLLRQIFRHGKDLAAHHPAFHGSPGEPHVRVARSRFFFQLFFLLFQIRFEKVPAFVLSFRIKACDPVAHAGHVLMREDPGPHVHAVEGAGHDHEGAVAAFGRILAEGLVKVQQLAKSRASADVHDPAVVFRAFRRETVGAAWLQLVRQIPARHEHGPPAALLHCLRNDLPQAVVIRERQAGQADPQDPAAAVFFPDEPERHHRAVIQFRIPLA